MKADALRSNLIRKISRCDSRINEEEMVSLKMKVKEHELVVLAPRQEMMGSHVKHATVLSKSQCLADSTTFVVSDDQSEDRFPKTEVTENNLLWCFQHTDGTPVRAKMREHCVSSDYQIAVTISAW